MPDFIFAYHGGKKPETAQEGADSMAKWEVWYQTLGTAVVQPGNPVGMSKTVNKDGVTDDGGSNPLSGYSVLKADDIDSAVALAKDCPMVQDGTGSVEVAELIVI